MYHDYRELCTHAAVGYHSLSNGSAVIPEEGVELGWRGEVGVMTLTVNFNHKLMSPDIKLLAL